MQNEPVLHEPSASETNDSEAGNSASSFLQDHLGVLLLVALSSVALFFRLGVHPLVSWDEAIYAEISKEFLRLHSWLVPHWNYQPWMEKPPLFLWITAAFFKAFGVSEFWARAASAFSGVGVVVLTYYSAKELKDSRLGWIAAVLLLTMRGFFQLSRDGKTDMMLTLWMLVALYGILWLTRNRRAGWYLFWCGSALAFMTKSAAAAPVFMALGVLVLVRRGLFGIVSRQFFVGVALFMAIVAPWHVYMIGRFGDAFIAEYLGRHIVARTMSPLEHHHESVLFYAILLLKWAFPWILVVPIGFWLAFRQKTLNVFHYFALIIVLFYTLVQTKLAHYVEPVYPSLAIIAAVPVYRWIRSWSKVAVLGAGAGLVLVFALVFMPPIENRIAARFGSPEVNLIRAHPMPGYNGPLLLCSDQVMVTMPAALFYAPAETEQTYIYSKPENSDSVELDKKTLDPRYWHAAPLSSELDSSPDLMLINKRLLTRLPAYLHFRPIAGTAKYELGIMALNGSNTDGTMNGVRSR